MNQPEITIMMNLTRKLVVSTLAAALLSSAANASLASVGVGVPAIPNSDAQRKQAESMTETCADPFSCPVEILTVLAKNQSTRIDAIITEVPMQSPTPMLDEVRMYGYYGEVLGD
jgi:hypothetical protein